MNSYSDSHFKLDFGLEKNKLGSENRLNWAPNQLRLRKSSNCASQGIKIPQEMEILEPQLGEFVLR